MSVKISGNCIVIDVDVTRPGFECDTIAVHNNRDFQDGRITVSNVRIHWKHFVLSYEPERIIENLVAIFKLKKIK